MPTQALKLLLGVSVRAMPGNLKAGARVACCGKDHRSFGKEHWQAPVIRLLAGRRPLAGRRYAIPSFMLAPALSHS